MYRIVLLGAFAEFRLLRVKHIPLYDIITQHGYYILKIYWICYIGYVQKEYVNTAR